MKYKRLGLIAALCFVSWLILAFVIFNEGLTNKNEEKETKKADLIKYITTLEKQIEQQQDLYKQLSAQFQELKQNQERPESVKDVQKVYDTLEKAKSINENLPKVPLSQTTLKSKEEESTNKDNVNQATILPIIVFSCNRPEAVRRCLDGLLKHRPDPNKFPIIVSQDCGHAATAQTIQSYGSQVTHIQQPDLSEPDVPPQENKFRGYFKISRHYLWGLKQIFRTLNHTAVIIVEDDLDIAPDFYTYFSSTHFLLRKDPSLWCVSAWNDNGKANLVDTGASELLYRSDFFPGLGWMITRDLWDELEPKWPKSYWDDWMRRPEQRKERACIRPEISRTKTFGKIGVSNGLFFDKHLKYIKLNENPVDFSSRNLTYLLQVPYDNDYLNRVYNAPVVTAADVRTNTNLPRGSVPVRIAYHTKDAYKNNVKLLGLMDDFKSGVPRTGYHGIVSFFYNGRRVYLAPNKNWKGYDLTWS